MVPSVKITTAFRDIASCSLVDTDVSEVFAASIISMMSRPNYAGTKYL
jgi:hypothetical protein